MRILGFSKKDWINYHIGKPKLQEPDFTTFRFRRRDRDWEIGEVVQVVYKPRSKDREPLGIAEIINKERRWIFTAKKPRGEKVLTPREAHADGFKGYGDMAMWLSKGYGHQRLVDEPMNKLDLRWVDGQTTA